MGCAIELARIVLQRNEGHRPDFGLVVHRVGDLLLQFSNSALQLFQLCLRVLELLGRGRSIIRGSRPRCRFQCLRVGLLLLLDVRHGLIQGQRNSEFYLNLVDVPGAACGTPWD
jgi:hypothetical protein